MIALIAFVLFLVGGFLLVPSQSRKSGQGGPWEFAAGLLLLVPLPTGAGSNLAVGLVSLTRGPADNSPMDFAVTILRVGFLVTAGTAAILLDLVWLRPGTQISF